MAVGKGAERVHELPPTGRWARWGWITTPITMFAASRLISGILLDVGADRQIALTENTPAYKVTEPTEASPGYLGVVSNWDGQWYRSIVESGYPIPMPVVDGQVVANEWAFAPAYPMLVRVVTALAGLDFPLAASLVSLACSGLAVVLLYRMLLQTGDRFVAFTAVLGLCAFPGAPILQVAYSESLALLLVVLALIVLRRHRYGWLMLVAAGLALTRPVVLPLAAVIGVHWLIRWRNSADSFPTRERWWAGASAIVTASLIGLWPIAVAGATGTSDAFVQTMSAWPSNQGDVLGPFGTWLVLAVTTPGVVTVFVGAVLVVIVYAVTREGSRSWGPELRAWSLLYPLFIIAATRPAAGIVRYLVLSIGPLWPLPDPAPSDETRRQHVLRWAMPLAFATAGFVGQYYWVTEVFTISQDPAAQPFP